MERCYSFGGIPVFLSAPAALPERAELTEFAHPIQKNGIQIYCAASAEFTIPGDMPLRKGDYDTLWRQTRETETGLNCYQRNSGEAWPYCLWTRQGNKVSVLWKPEVETQLSVWKILDDIELFHLLLTRGAAVLHGSYIVYKGQGIVFSAPSGTGKSTQAALWEQFRGAEVVNGDRCLLRAASSGVFVHGICYSGTSGICKNISVPLKALVLLEQAPENKIRQVKGLEAFRFLMPQCAYRTWDKWDVADITEVLAHILSAVPVFRLQCRPDVNAVETLEKVL